MKQNGLLVSSHRSRSPLGLRTSSSSSSNDIPVYTKSQSTPVEKNSPVRVTNTSTDTYNTTLSDKVTYNTPMSDTVTYNTPTLFPDDSRYGNIHIEIKSDSSDAPTSPSSSLVSSRLPRRLSNDVSFQSRPIDSTQDDRHTRLRQIHADKTRYRSETSANDVEIALELSKQFEAMNARFSSIDKLRQNRKVSSSTSNDKSSSNRKSLDLTEQQRLNRREWTEFWALKGGIPLKKNRENVSEITGQISKPCGSSESFQTLMLTKESDYLPEDHELRKGVQTLSQSRNPQNQTPFKHPTLDSLKYSSAMELNTQQEPPQNPYRSSDNLMSQLPVISTDDSPRSKQSQRLKERLHKSPSNPIKPTGATKPTHGAHRPRPFPARAGGRATETPPAGTSS